MIWTRDSYSIRSQSWEGHELKFEMEVTLIHLRVRPISVKILDVLGDHISIVGTQLLKKESKFFDLIKEIRNIPLR
jgi:hypothetical protein